MRHGSHRPRRLCLKRAFRLPLGLPVIPAGFFLKEAPQEQPDPPPHKQIDVHKNVF